MIARPTWKSTAAPHLMAGKSVGVVGLGQIGGSIVKRLSRYQPQITVLGTDIDSAIAKRVRRYCRWCVSLDEIVEQSDILVLAVHVPRILDLLPLVASKASGRTRRSRLLVTDTGTIKDPVVQLARCHRTAFDFVGTHPLAGSHRPGWDGSHGNLFDGCTTIYCADRPTRNSRLIRELILLLGAKPLRMQAAEHDDYIGLTIGLPHLLAYSAQGLSRDLNVPPAVKGRSWASLTRIAASDPAMVTGFLHTNANAVTSAAHQLRRHLDRLVAALKDPADKKLEALLREWRRDPVG